MFRDFRLTDPEVNEVVSVVVMFVGCCVVVFVFSMHYSCALFGSIWVYLSRISPDGRSEGVALNVLRALRTTPFSFPSKSYTHATRRMKDEPICKRRNLKLKT